MQRGRVGTIHPPGGGRVHGLCRQDSDPASPWYRNNRGIAAASGQLTSGGGGESKLLAVVMEKGQHMGTDPPIGSDAVSGRKTSLGSISPGRKTVPM